MDSAGRSGTARSWGVRLLRDLCFSNDLTHFFVAEWRAEDVHSNVGGDSPQLGHVSGKKAPPLDILEEAFETAGGERRREADTLGTISPPRCKNEGKMRRPKDRLAFRILIGQNIGLHIAEGGFGLVFDPVVAAIWSDANRTPFFASQRLPNNRDL